jgi:hypothetical protein
VGQARGDQVLFCPFCRESFEGVRRCPDHELDLVPWHALPMTPTPVDEATRLAPYSLQLGRGWLLAGALITLVAFVLPMLTLSGDPPLHANMLRFASLRAGKLWMVPLSSIAVVMLVLRRRTPRAMRGARLAVAVLALMPLMSLAITLRGVWSATAALSARTGDAMELTVEWGSYTLLLGTLLMLRGAWSLGVVPQVAEGHDPASG